MVIKFCTPFHFGGVRIFHSVKLINSEASIGITVKNRKPSSQGEIKRKKLMVSRVLALRDDFLMNADFLPSKCGLRGYSLTLPDSSSGSSPSCMAFAHSSGVIFPETSWSKFGCRTLAAISPQLVTKP